MQDSHLRSRALSKALRLIALSAAALVVGKTAVAAETVAVRFHGEVVRSACSITVGSGDAIELGRVALGQKGPLVPVDLYFSDCSAGHLSSFKLVGTGGASANGELPREADGLLPTNLDDVKVRLTVNDKGKPGAALSLNKNVLADGPIAVNAKSTTFAWRPLWAQLDGKKNRTTGEVIATGFFELKYQ